MEDDPPAAAASEHAVDNDTMEVRVPVEGGTEPVDERDRAQARRWARARNRRFTFIPYFDYGPLGKSFIVRADLTPAP